MFSDVDIAINNNVSLLFFNVFVFLLFYEEPLRTLDTKTNRVSGWIK